MKWKAPSENVQMLLLSPILIPALCLIYPAVMMAVGMDWLYRRFLAPSVEWHTMLLPPEASAMTAPEQAAPERDSAFRCVGCGEPINAHGERVCDCATGIIFRRKPQTLFVAPDAYRSEAEACRQRAIELDAKAEEVKAEILAAAIARAIA